ncbi:hypothetical protein [Scytonema millei]|uniref:Uncharacterized protein n=1 Tax=Scytonema millei VB511283 TaxID=1245923 RepID=A0A9X5E984_9CYAN|nr:hypothetical protein [Scytonema millei]NHC37113.1 hypothetical protein [Scytonema millei VB511283]
MTSEFRILNSLAPRLKFIYDRQKWRYYGSQIIHIFLLTSDLKSDNLTGDRSPIAGQR